MSRPTGFADLAGLNVGIWGFGVEGDATYRRLRDTAKSIVLVDDVANPESGVVATSSGGLELLRECDVVLKSPGIPRRREEVAQLEASGVVVTSALNLWLHDVDRTRVIAVTGTKGKSTTTSLITFFLSVLDQPATSAGNIGQPPYDPDFVDPGWIVLEVSSYQAVDIEVAPGLVVITSLGSDHLDWHGTLERYQSDKLSLTRAEGPHVTLAADDPMINRVQSEIGGELSFIAADTTDLTRRLGLIGQHNESNVALALAACALVTGNEIYFVRTLVEAAAERFQPLPGRLTLVRQRSNISYVDDGLATAPLPTIAALEVFRETPVSLIVGGFDRGVDYTSLAEALAHRSAATTLVVMPDVGERIITTVLERCRIDFVRAATMDEAVRFANDAVAPTGGVVLFSPAAPSFGAYKNWRERSDDFGRAVALLD